jgi:lipopolysaccharide assembly protein A
MKGQSYVIIAIIFMIVVAIFAVTNVNPVQVSYFFWQVESPLILVILFSVLMGGIITAAVGMVRMFRMQKEIKRLKKDNQKLIELVDRNGLADAIINSPPDTEKETDNLY